MIKELSGGEARGFLPPYRPKEIMFFHVELMLCWKFSISKPLIMQENLIIKQTIVLLLID